MRLSDAFLEQLRANTDIESVISPYVNLRRRGKNLVGLCPFHNEKTPSFTVYPENGSFYCFGCGVGGDVITFVRRMENLNYMEAVKQLADRAGMALPEDGYDDTLAKKRTAVLAANRAAAKFFHAQLYTEQGRQALDYFLDRGLAPETIRHFGLGFAPNDWRALKRHLNEQGFDDVLLESANLLRRSDKNGKVSYYDNFRNRVMFPIIDPRGNVIAFGGRVLDDSKPKYINTSDTLVYKKSNGVFALNFAKNGNDVTTAAIMTARAHTHRKKIIFINGFYHGISPWTQKVDYPGVIEEDVANNIYIDWNDIPALERVIAENEGEIAAFISTPYLHGNFFDNQLPADGYWQKVRELCTKNGIVLIVDDVRAGFRLDIAGSDHFYGFEADLICFCKALANGWNVSALCGKEFLKSSISSLSYTGSYWLSAIPFAAGIACINKMKKLNTPAIFREKGLKVGEGLKAAAANNGFHLVVSGEPSLFYLRLADDDSLMLHQEWIAEMVKRGIFLTSHHNHFLNASLTDEDIAHTVDVAEDAFNTLRKNHPELA